MLARLICFLLGHVFDEFTVLESPQPYVCVRRGKCARCGMPILDVHLEGDAPEEGLEIDG